MLEDRSWDQLLDDVADSARLEHDPDIGAVSRQIGAGARAEIDRRITRLLQAAASGAARAWAQRVLDNREI